MRARSLGCSPDVVAHLDGLASRTHNALYAPRPYRLDAAWHLLSRGFPRTLRKNWRFLVVATFLFAFPFVVGIAGSLTSAEFARGVLPTSMLEQMAENYAEGFESGRGGGQDSAMAGFYVYNNVGIAFRCFATGILFGAGSVFFLVYNGLIIGTVFGYVMTQGGGTNILTFTSGHAPFELTAIVISGAAGMQMGYALVDTGGRTRLGSLRSQSKELVDLVVGTAVMLVIAAAIEGFWSPSSVSPEVKWAFAGCSWLAVFAYFILAGRWSSDSERGRFDRRPGSERFSLPPEWTERA